MFARLLQYSLLALLGTLILSHGTASAQSPAPVTVPAGTPVCNCGVYTGPHYHLTAQSTTTPRLFGRSAGLNNRTNNSGLTPNEQGLPRGRRYYGGRYFGSFNDRFYGPQYGYF